jgi:hypothetical protein
MYKAFSHGSILRSYEERPKLHLSQRLKLQFGILKATVYGIPLPTPHHRFCAGHLKLPPRVPGLLDCSLVEEQ